MAGIGFILRKLVQRDDLAGVMLGYLYAAVVSSGPWLFTIVSLGLLVLISNQFLLVEELAEFRIVIIYNFGFSLVFASPVFMVATRFLADLIYDRDVSRAPGMLFGTLTVLFVLLGPLVGAFYVGYAEMSAWVRVAAIANFFLITGIWLVSVFMSALKEYSAIARTFAFGMAVALTASVLLAPDFSVAGMLMGFNLGLAVIFFDLMARVLAEFPHPVRTPFAFLRYFRTHWEVALAGMIYNMAIWADKWVMWFAPERSVQASGLISYPHYDGAMFLAYLAIVPAIALFTFSVETRFFEQYLRFYQDIQQHATYERIQRNHRSLWETILESARNLLVLQVTIAISLILLAPALLEWLQASALQLGMFRFGVLGALFHAFAMFLMIILSYFDARLKVLFVALVFLISNTGLTWLSMQWGMVWYGWGYAVAAMITFAVAYVLTARHMKRLPYETFIVRNLSIDMRH
ncbi:MAG TPA: hypothetical protein EYH03_07345 [Chromatiales bacterium]|nr:hypothetical protein [Chromatiales bacterium]